MLDGLERLRDVGPAAVEEFLPELASDIAAYRVIERRPTETVFRGMRVATCPPPSLGGEVIARGLAALDPGTNDGDQALAVAIVDALRRGYGGSAGPGFTGTTHVSVIDDEGNAAALSSTLGSGSGEFSQGFQLNNMLGELDVIGTEARSPGERLPSMMAPTLVLADGETRLVLGSAGSVRLSGAILQVDSPRRCRRSLRRAGDRPSAAARRGGSRPGRRRLAGRDGEGAPGGRPTRSIPGRGGTSTSEASRPSNVGLTAGSGPQVIHGVAVTGSSSRDRDPPCRVGRCAGARRARERDRKRGRLVASDDRGVAHRCRRTALSSSGSPSSGCCRLRRRGGGQGVSPAFRSRGTCIRRAGTLVTSG